MTDLSITLHREVPPEIVRLAHEEFMPRECVTEVLFTGPTDQLEGHMAVLVPANGSVVIDLDRCVRDLRWMDLGATFVANAWFNVLYCIYHECNHAYQVDHGLPEIEDDCDMYARDSMFEWLKEHRLPKLAEMGYLTDVIKDVLNKMWGKHQQLVELEINVAGVAAAHVLNAATRISAFENNSQISALVTEVMEGRAGIVVDGEPYLTAEEFIVAVDSDVSDNPDEYYEALRDVLINIKQSKKEEVRYA